MCTFERAGADGSPNAGHLLQYMKHYQSRPNSVAAVEEKKHSNDQAGSIR